MVKRRKSRKVDPELETTRITLPHIGAGGAERDRPHTDILRENEGGTKYDDMKIRFDLVPVEVEVAVARVLTKGAIKYTPRNWEKGIRYGRCYAAARRHMAEFWNGNSHDEESGEHVLAHAICMLSFMLAYELRGMGHVYTQDGGPIDDRPGNTTDIPMLASIPLTTPD